MMKPTEIETIQIEVNTDCNLSCPFCPCASFYSGRPRRHMAFEEFREVFERSFESPHVTIFSGFSETLLNPEVFRMIDFEKRRGNHVLLATNGVLLDEERISKILDLRVDGLTLTLDTLDAEQYVGMRGADKLSTVLKNLTNLQDAVSRRAAATEVIVNFVVTRKTARWVEEILRLMHPMGLTSLFLIKLMRTGSSHADFFEREGLSWEELESLDHERIHELAERLGIVVHRSSRRGLVDPGCSLPRSGIYLTSSWDVYICPFHVSCPQYELGNLMESSIEEIRSSARYREILSLFEGGGHLPECRDCACLFERI